jgi:hypothetical protein
MAGRGSHWLYSDLLTEPFLRQKYVVEQSIIVSIAVEVGVSSLTVRNSLKQFAIPIRPEPRPHLIDCSGFVNLSSDWHAYWLGFIAADGCVYVDEQRHDYRLQIVLKLSDADHLRDFQRGIQASAPVIVGFNGQRDVAKITISDRFLVDALATWGIVPNKSLIIRWPDHLPDALVPAFIRGYFDGNGTIYQRHRSNERTSWTETVCRFVSGSVPFLDSLEQELAKRNIRIVKRYRNQDTNAHVLPLSGRKENLLAFADMIYEGSAVSLPRKKALFDSLREI